MSETSTFLIRICQSTTPRLSGYGCCLEKGAENVLSELQQQVQSYGLGDQVKIRPVNCLKNCHQGVSVQVIPGPVWYGKMEAKDIQELIEEHLLNGKVLEALRVANPNSFF